MSYSHLINLFGLNLEISRLERQAKLGWDKEFRMLKQLGLTDSVKILEVGSGPGFYTKLLLDNLPQSEITALEIEDKLINVSKEYLKSYDENRVQFVNKSILSSGLPDGLYDWVIVRFVMQHIKEQIVAINEIKRLLKPGGAVILIDSDKGISTMDNVNSKFMKQRDEANRFEKESGWNRQCGRNLVRILRTGGFKDIDFDSVTVHSDLVGIENMIGKMPINIMPKNGPPMIWINFIAKGIKEAH